MGRKSRGGGGGVSKEKRGGGKASSGAPTDAGAALPQPPFNFVSDAGPGCHIARDPSSSPWALGYEPYNPEDYDEGASVPDIGVDPRENVVSVTNAGAETVRVCYVSVYDAPCRGRDGVELRRGSTVDDEGNARGCTTFVVLCPPATFVHLCRLDLPPGRAISDVRIDSDVSDLSPHPRPEDEHPLELSFPLLCRRSADGSSPPGDDGDEDLEGAAAAAEPSYLCTQGEGGHLTHFLKGNYHAVDFRCQEGTPVLAAGDGVVVDVRDENTLTGVAVGNLYKWNSVMIELDTEGFPAEAEAEAAATGEDGADGEGPSSSSSAAAASAADGRAAGRGGPLFVEYVHILARSALVKPGQRVTRGQPVCRSGSVGFSPEPHLHFSAFRSEDPAAPTVRVRFRSEDGTPGERGFVPRAGVRYDGNGPVDGKAGLS